MCARTRSCTNSPGGCSKTEWRDADEEPKLYLFGQLKQITRRWLGSHLVCTGRAFPAQLMYRELADRACERIHQGIVSRHEGDRPVKAMLDPYNPGAPPPPCASPRPRPVAGRLPPTSAT